MKKLFGLVFALLLTLMLIGCGAKVVSISVVTDSIPVGKEVAEFSLSDLKLNVEYSDGTVEEVGITREMLGEYAQLLNTAGTHQIKVVYEGKETTFSITLVDKLKEVIDLINSLPETLSESDIEKVKEAREKYDALSEAKKTLVSNYSKLKEKETEARVLKVEIAISKIPSEITEADFDLILEVKDAYDALDESEKGQVNSYSKLEEAITTMEQIKLSAGIDIEFDVNGQFWIGDYKENFEAAAKFGVKVYNVYGDWGKKIILASKGNSAAAGLYWDRIYFKYDSSIGEYIVVGKLSSGGKFEETPVYEYSIGYNSTNNEDAAFKNAYLEAFKVVEVGDILKISGIDLKTLKAGNIDATFEVYHQEDLKNSVSIHVGMEDEFPVLKSQQLEFTGWYTTPECTGEAVTEIALGMEKLYAGWEEKIKIQKIEVSNEINEIVRYESYNLKWKITPSNASVQTVNFISSNEDILKINSKGVISALKEGTVTIKVVSTINASVYDEFEVCVYTPGRIEVIYKTSSIVEVGKEIHLEAEYAGRVEGNITWASADEGIATVNSNGIVTGVGVGSTTIIVTCDTVKTEIGVTVVDKIEELDPLIQYLISTTQFNPQSFTATSYGSPHSKGPELSSNPYYADILGSINLILFEKFETVEMIAPETNSNRPGEVYKKHYIVVHDTGTYTTATGKNFANNVVSPTSETSWQYTVAPDGIYHTIPDNEWSYHAGDSGREYALENSGVIATTSAEDAVISINANGYYTINGQDTKLRPYKDVAGTVLDMTNYPASKINSQGVRCIVQDGYYYLGKTWYNASYDFIGNFGGNKNGIGIESSVSIGTDYYYTWQKLAKLVANLMLQNNLIINDVKAHHFFSGKPCPQVILWNDKWDHFIEMVKAEYEMITTFKDYTVTLTYDDTKLMDSNGRLNRQNASSNVTYTITVTKDGQSQSITLSSMVPGLYTIE